MLNFSSFLLTIHSCLHFVFICFCVKSQAAVRSHRDSTKQTLCLYPPHTVLNLMIRFNSTLFAFIDTLILIRFDTSQTVRDDVGRVGVVTVGVDAPQLGRPDVCFRSLFFFLSFFFNLCFLFCDVNSIRFVLLTTPVVTFFLFCWRSKDRAVR